MESAIKTVEKYGTPLFIFDERVLAERIKSLRKRLPEEVDLCYAVKANTFVTACAAKYVERLEICSPGEYDICKKYGIGNRQTVISGVNKTEEYIKKVIADTVSNPAEGIFTAESVRQADMLEKAAGEAGKNLNVLLRLSSGNQFGMDEAELKAIVCRNREKYPHLCIKGIQYFSGTQKHSLKKDAREIAYVNEFMDRLYEETGFVCEELEYGTGFPVFYFQGESFDEDSFLKDFSELIRLSSLKRKTVLEIGRSIAAGCGSYASRVVDLKTVKGQNYAILDGGINQLVYYGQTMAMKHPYYKRFPEKKDGGEENWNLCGSLCTVNDILVKQLPIKKLEAGDIFIFKNTGAYSATEGIALFLSRQLPRVVRIKESGEAELVREAFETSVLNS